MVGMPPRMKRGSGLLVPSATTTAQMVDQRRGSAHDRGYTSRWAKARLGYLAKHPLCVAHLANGRTAAATVVDHIVPHDGDMRLFWDVSNWQPLSEWAHNSIKKALEHRWYMGQIPRELLRLDRRLSEWFPEDTPGGGVFL